MPWDPKILLAALPGYTYGGINLGGIVIDLLTYTVGIQSKDFFKLSPIICMHWDGLTVGQHVINLSRHIFCLSECRGLPNEQTSRFRAQLMRAHDFSLVSFE